MNDLYIEWKYDGKTIFKSKETDYHCGVDTMEIMRNKEEVWFKLRSKTTAEPYILKLKPVTNLDYLEVWTANGKYYQHNLNFSHLVNSVVQSVAPQSIPQSTKPDTEVSTPSNATTSKPKLDKAINHIDELKKKQAEGKLKPSEIKKQKLAKNKEIKKTLKEWLEKGKITEEKYNFLNEYLDEKNIFSLAEINDKYWELKEKE